MAQGQGGPGSFDPSMRASDADRERLVEQLREHHAAGRLSLDEFEERMRKAYDSRTYGELRVLTRDLPVDLATLNVQSAARQTPKPNATIEIAGRAIDLARIQDRHERHQRRSLARRGGRGAVVAGASSWAALSVLLTGIWLMSNLTGGGDWGNFWPIWPIGITGILLLTRGINRSGRG